MRNLTLTIGGLTTTLTRFTAYERVLADTGQTEYSIVGTPLDTGLVYEPKHVWTVSAMVTYEQWFSLGAIFRKSDALRRNQGNYRILVEDSVENFVEMGVRTREVAPGGNEINFAEGVAYPAAFYARMFEPKSQWQRNQLYPYIASFTLRELDKATSPSTPGGGNDDTTPPPINNVGRWVSVTSDLTLQPNVGYAVNGTGTIDLVMPAIASIGDSVIIAGTNAATWRLRLDNSQSVRLGDETTTQYLESTGAGDSITLVCISPNNWLAISVQGSFSVI